MPLGQKGPIVSFTFDDFPRSAFTAGAPILESFAARATYYVAMSLMKQKNALGEQFHREDLCALLERGHELGSHTFSHVSARKVSHREFKQDVEKGDFALQKTLGAAPSGNFAYPFGDVSVAIKKEIGPTLRSCRGTCGGVNGPEVDLNLLRANSLYGDMDCLAAAKRLIEKNQQERSWLVFYSHDIGSHPSPFGCTPQLLQAVCSHAVASGARLLTIAQVTQELVPDPSLADGCGSEGPNVPLVHQS